MSDAPNNGRIFSKPISRLRRTERFARAYNQASNGNFTAVRNTLTEGSVVIRPYGMDFTNPASFHRNRAVIKRYLNSDIGEYRKAGGGVRMVV